MSQQTAKTNNNNNNNNSTFTDEDHDRYRHNRACGRADYHRGGDILIPTPLEPIPRSESVWSLDTTHAIVAKVKDKQW